MKTRHSARPRFPRLAAAALTIGLAIGAVGCALKKPPLPEPKIDNMSEYLREKCEERKKQRKTTDWHCSFVDVIPKAGDKFPMFDAVKRATPKFKEGLPTLVLLGAEDWCPPCVKAKRLIYAFSTNPPLSKGYVFTSGVLDYHVNFAYFDFDNKRNRKLFDSVQTSRVKKPGIPKIFLVAPTGEIVGMAEQPTAIAISGSKLNPDFVSALATVAEPIAPAIDPEPEDLGETLRAACRDSKYWVCSSPDLRFQVGDKLPHFGVFVRSDPSIKNGRPIVLSFAPPGPHRISNRLDAVFNTTKPNIAVRSYSLHRQIGGSSGSIFLVNLLKFTVGPKRNAEVFNAFVPKGRSNRRSLPLLVITTHEGTVAAISHSHDPIAATSDWSTLDRTMIRVCEHSNCRQ